MRHLTKSRLPLIAIVIFAFAAGCSPGSASNSAGSPAGEAVTSSVKLKPSPAKAKYDKGRMFKDGCIVQRKNTSPRGCIYGNRKSDVSVVLLGDSHALQYGPPMIKLAKQRNWRLLALARGRCMVARVSFDSLCDKWRRKAMKRIRKFKPDMVVVSTATGSKYRAKRRGKLLSRKASEPVLRTGMAKTLRQLRKFKSKRGKRAKVILIRDQALAPFRPPDCLKKKANRRKPSRCGFKAKRSGSTAFDFHGARRVKAVQIIDPMKLLCPKGWCRSVDRGMIVYRDKYHYTATWAVTMTPWLGARMGGLR